MKKSDKIIVGISIGDPNGIGLEVVFKSFEDARMFDFCTPIVFGHSKSISEYKKILGLEHLKVVAINDVTKPVPNKINVVNSWKESVKLELGNETETGGRCAFQSLEAATKALKNNKIDVLVTAPINKNNIQSDRFNFKGHTEYLDEHLSGDSLMILMTADLKIGLITGHIPISQVAESITSELITQKVEILYSTLQRDFGIAKPKIAVLGLNPHCGDQGVIGDEDDATIRPTLETMQSSGKLVYGPYAADSFFGAATYKQFDAVLAMYHDQGLGPFKTLSFGRGVNFTAGLSHIRTSPDHGTAYEIAGKNKANHQSFKEAVFTAIAIHRSRKNQGELERNRLLVNDAAKN